MFVQTVLVSLVAILLGLALCVGGYRFFVTLLPIWAFLAGLAATGTTLTAILGTGFFATILSWVLGLLVGLGCALFAYLFYYAAILILGATVGYLLGVGVMTWMGFRLGVVSVLVGLTLGAVFAVAVAFLRLPKLLIIVLTALAGAASLLAGGFLAVGSLTLEDLQWGVVGAVIRTSWWWALVYLALVALSIAVQWQVTARSYVLQAYEREFAAPEVYRTGPSGTSEPGATGSTTAGEPTPPTYSPPGLPA